MGAGGVLELEERERPPRGERPSKPDQPRTSQTLGPWQAPTGLSYALVEL